MSILQAQQLHDNAENANKTELWEDFRMRMEAIINRVNEIRPIFGGRALLLGAGNGNDIPLKLIEEKFDEIVLVDIDKTALNRLIQKVDSPEKFKLVTADLSGIAEQLPSSLVGKREAELIKLMQNLKYNPQWTNLVHGPFDFIMTCHFTTQLVAPIFGRLSSSLNAMGPYNTTLNELALNIVAGLMTSIHSLLAANGLFFHSTDTFELSADGQGKPIRPGTAEIVKAVKGDLNMLHTILPVYIELMEKGYHITGSSLPANVPELFDSLTHFVTPWNFEQTPSLMKQYVVFGHAFNKKV